MVKKFHSEPVYDDKYIKTKINSYEDRVITNFQGKEVPKEKALYKCLSLTLLVSVIKVVDKKYYPQTLLEECKYEMTKNKMENLMNDDFDSSSESDSEFDSKPDNELGDEVDE